MTVERTTNGTPVVAEERAAVLRDSVPLVPASELDRRIFETLVPEDHLVRRAEAAVNFEAFRPLLAKGYSPDHGRPAEDVVRMLKLEFLQFYYNLSDRQVIDRARTDVAFRWFLRLNLDEELPDPSLLTYFRGRLGVEGHQAVFDQVLQQAREHHLVRDRLRLKDATEVVASVAIPATLRLVAQIRERLLSAARPFDALRVEGERARIEVIRARDSSSDAERLAARVTHLREMLAWVDDLTPPDEAAQNRAWQRLVEARRIARKILADQADPQAGDRTRSAVDPDARRGKHGGYYDGYLTDILVDADSELITAVNVLPANGDEAADAAVLIQREETACGNDVSGLSIDGVGFNGPVLRHLQDPQGLNLDVFVPPKEPANEGRFGPEDFQEDPERQVVVCPAGQESRYRQRDETRHVTIYRFVHSTCRACPLLSRCMPKPPEKLGRSVHKNDYQPEYQRVHQKATTAEYAAVRAEHPRVERKLADLVRNHGARKTRYRGLLKTLCQQLMACTAANVKRMIGLLAAPILPSQPI